VRGALRKALQAEHDVLEANGFAESTGENAAKAAECLSHAEIAQACEQAAKNAILDHSTAVRDSELALALEERRTTHA
jgi:hypothetical protein